MASGDTGGVGGSSHMAMRVQPAAGLAVTVEMGNAVINTPGLGAYMCALDSQKTLGLAAASATANRIDLIIARVYDDLNSAIASAAGVRKFVVEVWTGDGSTGTPTPPAPTPTAGWTPLAAVRVNKGTATVTAANIIDLRGPSLVARGGMRALYGQDSKPASDSFSEPGAYPGDQRWVHNSGFQHQVYYGAGNDPATSGWRGVFNAIRYTANPPPGEFSFVSGYGVSRELCRLTIPYPGTPFMIYATARASITLSANSAADLRINIGSETGPDVNWTRFHTYGANADKLCVPNVMPILYGVFTSDATVVLSCGMRDNASQYSGFRLPGQRPRRNPAHRRGLPLDRAATGPVTGQWRALVADTVTGTVVSDVALSAEPQFDRSLCDRGSWTVELIVDEKANRGVDFHSYVQPARYSWIVAYDDQPCRAVPRGHTASTTRTSG